MMLALQKQCPQIAMLRCYFAHICWYFGCIWLMTHIFWLFEGKIKPRVPLGRSWLSRRPWGTWNECECWVVTLGGGGIGWWGCINISIYPPQIHRWILEPPILRLNVCTTFHPANLISLAGTSPLVDYWFFYEAMMVFQPSLIAKGYPRQFGKLGLKQTLSSLVDFSWGCVPPSLGRRRSGWHFPRILHGWELCNPSHAQWLSIAFITVPFTSETWPKCRIMMDNVGE